MAERTRWRRGCPHCANSTCHQAGKAPGRTERCQRLMTEVPHPTSHRSLRGAPPQECVRHRTQHHLQATARAANPDSPSKPCVGTLSRRTSRARSPILWGTPLRWQWTAGLQNVATTTLGHARWSRDGATVVVAATGGVLRPDGAGGERAGRARNLTISSHPPPIRRLADAT